MTRHRGCRRHCPRIPTGRETELKPPTVWVRIPPGTPPTVAWPAVDRSRAASSCGRQPQQGGAARRHTRSGSARRSPAGSRRRRGHRFPATDSRNSPPLGVPARPAPRRSPRQRRCCPTGETPGTDQRYREVVPDLRHPASGWVMSRGTGSGWPPGIPGELLEGSLLGDGVVSQPRPARLRHPETVMRGRLNIWPWRSIQPEQNSGALR